MDGDDWLLTPKARARSACLDDGHGSAAIHQIPIRAQMLRRVAGDVSDLNVTSRARRRANRFHMTTSVAKGCSSILVHVIDSTHETHEVGFEAARVAEESGVLGRPRLRALRLQRGASG
jgi:hypothetical protein